MILFLPDSSTAFYYNMWSCDCMMVTFNMTLNLNLDPKIEKKSKNEKENKINSSLTSVILTSLPITSNCE